MTDHAPEFKASYNAFYGKPYAPLKPDYSRCASEVWSGLTLNQCSRKNGHGPHGAHCKQHDPVAQKAKDDARRAELYANAAAVSAKWATEKRREDFSAACRIAVRKIAEGTVSDPQAMAQDIVERLG